MSAKLSRVAREPIDFDNSVKIEAQKELDGCFLTITGPKGVNKVKIPGAIEFLIKDNVFTITKGDSDNVALAGTMRALIFNAVQGTVSEFKRNLALHGTGYRAQIKDDVLNLSLGFSNPINFKIPKGVKILTPSQTEIEVTSVDKQLLGLVCANIRKYRPPEPYKGKGIRYIYIDSKGNRTEEIINRKEVKKK